jgi:hypothetical protein
VEGGLLVGALALIGLNAEGLGGEGRLRDEGVVEKLVRGVGGAEGTEELWVVSHEVDDVARAGLGERPPAASEIDGESDVLLEVAGAEGGELVEDGAGLLFEGAEGGVAGEQAVGE